jgi:hypothetical protein
MEKTIRGAENAGAHLPVKSLAAAIDQGGESGSNDKDLGGYLGQGGKGKASAPGTPPMRKLLGQ